MPKVFYVPGQTTIIDHARQIGPEIWIAQHSGLMLPELHIRHPGAVLADEETFRSDQERASRNLKSHNGSNSTRIEE